MELFSLNSLLIIVTFIWKVKTNNIPSLGTVVVNLHPSAQEEFPLDHDGFLNKNNNIIFSDSSVTEEGYLLIISDYFDLVKHFTDLLI